MKEGWGWGYVCKPICVTCYYGFTYTLLDFQYYSVCGHELADLCENASWAVCWLWMVEFPLVTSHTAKLCFCVGHMHNQLCNYRMTTNTWPSVCVCVCVCVCVKITCQDVYCY